MLYGIELDVKVRYNSNSRRSGSSLFLGLEMSAIRILVVDDHEVIRRVICSLLSSDPTLDVVCQTADGEQAVLKAKELQPDLVLLDISLPGISGIEAARRIRKDLAEFAHHLSKPARFAASGGECNAHGRPRIRCQDRCGIGAPQGDQHCECRWAVHQSADCVPGLENESARPRRYLTDAELEDCRPRDSALARFKAEGKMPSGQPARCRRYSYFSNNRKVSPTANPMGYPGVPCTRNR